MERDLLETLKTFSEPTRLRVLGLLADGRPRTRDEIAAAVGSGPAALARHLRRLTDADLVRVVHPGERLELRLERLAAIGRDLDELQRASERAGSTTGDPDGGSTSAEDGRVLRAFLVDGRLERIPAQEKKRQVVLRYLARTDFVDGEAYPERDVNMRLALRHPDVAALRRYLVDSGYMQREAGIYRLRPEATWPDE